MLSIGEGSSIERPLLNPIVPSDPQGCVWVYPTTSLLQTAAAASSTSLCKLSIWILFNMLLQK